MNADTFAAGSVGSPHSSFVGWRRENRRQPWRRVVEADSEDAALDKLLSEPPGDKIVLPAGRDPNQREVGP